MCLFVEVKLLNASVARVPAGNLAQYYEFRLEVFVNLLLEAPPVDLPIYLEMLGPIHKQNGIVQRFRPEDFESVPDPLVLELG